MGKFQINNSTQKVKLSFWFAIYCVCFFKAMQYIALHVLQYITKFLKQSRNKGTVILTGDLGWSWKYFRPFSIKGSFQFCSVFIAKNQFLTMLGLFHR